MIVLTESAVVTVPDGVSAAHLVIWGGASQEEQGEIVRDVLELSPGETLRVTVAAGGRAEITWLRFPTQGDAALYGVCLVCHAPRTVVRTVDADGENMSLVCSADQNHDTFPPAEETR